MGARREMAAFRAETAQELAGMERLIWGDNRVELEAHLQRQQTRHELANVPADLIAAFQAISRACWEENQRVVARSGGQHSGIPTDLVDARTAVHRAIGAHLLRNQGRRARNALRRAAVNSVRTVTEARMDPVGPRAAATRLPADGPANEPTTEPSTEPPSGDIRARNADA